MGDGQGPESLLSRWASMRPRSAVFFNLKEIEGLGVASVSAGLVQVLEGLAWGSVSRIGTTTGRIACKLGRSMSSCSCMFCGFGCKTGWSEYLSQCFRCTMTAKYHRPLIRYGFSRSIPKLAWECSASSRIFRSSRLCILFYTGAGSSVSSELRYSV